jgi:hypothetical protein
MILENSEPVKQSDDRDFKRALITISAKNSVVYPASELKDIGRDRRLCLSIISISFINIEDVPARRPTPTNTLFLNQTKVLTLTIVETGRLP